MSPRTTAVLAFVAAVLAILVLQVDRGGDGEGGVLFPGLDPQAVQSVAWVTSGARARAARDGEAWRIVEPVIAPADPAALQQVTGALAALRHGGRVEDPVEAAVYGLGPDATTIVFVADGVERSLSLGSQNPLGSAVYARLPERPDEVLLVPVQQASVVDRDLDGLRDRRVVALEPDAVTALRIESSGPGGGFEAALSRSEAGWRIDEPAPLAADGAAIDRLLSDLSLLRAERFVDAPGPRELGALAEPHFVARATTSAGEVRFVLAGPDGEGGLRLVQGRADAVFRVRDALVQHLPARLFELRDRSVLRIDPDAIRVLEVAGPETGPRRFEPSQALVASFAELDAVGFLAEALGARERAELGLDPDRIRVRVLGEDDAVLGEIGLGVALPKRGLVARAAGRETIFVVDPGLESALHREGEGADTGR